MSLAEAASHPRPLPPNRHRPSLSTSGSASFQAALGSRVSVEKTASPNSHLDVEESGMTDDEVGLMSREELEVALRQAYAWRETVGLSPFFTSPSWTSRFHEDGLRVGDEQGRLAGKYDRRSREGERSPDNPCDGTTRKR